jgi:Concanavalin A-like lectin/glucanases superfamily
MRLRPSLLVALGVSALAGPTAAQREEDLVAHWRFSAEYLAAGAFTPLTGELVLRTAGPQGFLGQGEQQALLCAESWGALAGASRLPGKDLPARRMTVEAWVGLDRPGAWGGFLCAIEDNGEHERGWVLGYRKDRFLFGLASEGLGRLSYLEAPRPFQLGRWYHVAGVYDGEVQRLFVDGELVAESRVNSGKILYDRDHLLVAGAYRDSNESYPMLGALYELRLWKRALSRRDLERRARQLAPNMPAPGKAGSFTGYHMPSGPTVRELQPAINKAIDRGSAWLMERQHRDGSWEAHNTGYRNGMTALALYTLLKQGVPASHPAVANGLAYLRRRLPNRTYSAGCMLMALAATGNKAHGDWAQEIVDLLVDWERGATPGAYGYPNAHVDLSNTQYAALGLWAAGKLGVEAPKGLWQRLVLNAAQVHQTNVVDLEWEGRDARAHTGKRKIAGFNYAGDGGKETGSMTAAGLCILGTAKDAAGLGLGRKVTGITSRSERLGLDWLAEHWTVDSSPGGGQHLYFLYGLERVGALYRTEFIGEHEWYPEGARKLLKMQKEGGEWGGEPDTCFALLFLSRATASSTGPGVSAKSEGWESREGEAWLRVTGSETVAMWITGFDGAVLADRKDLPTDQAGLRVVKVEFLGDGEVIATVEGDPSKPWKGERFAARHAFAAFGEHSLRARVHVLSPGGGSALEVLESGPLQVRTRLSPEAFQRRHMEREQPGFELLDPEYTLIEASTVVADPFPADKVVDGMQSTRWLCAVSDDSPWLRLELRGTQRATGLRLSPAASALHLAEDYEAIERARVIVNGKTEYELVFPEGGLTWATLHFGRELRVRSLEVRLEGRRLTGTRSAGLAELSLLGKGRKRRR